MHALHELSESTDGDVREHVLAAREAVSASREGVEGV
jgi:hypothetical protein